MFSFLDDLLTFWVLVSFKKTDGCIANQVLGMNLKISEIFCFSKLFVSFLCL
jgi:hypothetical protein